MASKSLFYVVIIPSLLPHHKSSLTMFGTDGDSERSQVSKMVPRIAEVWFAAFAA